MSNWLRQWDAPGKVGKIYRVSQHHMGWFACSCPMWLHQRAPHSEREDCKHILQIKLNLERQETRRLTGRVFEVWNAEAIERDNEILPKRRILINEQRPPEQNKLSDTTYNNEENDEDTEGREHRGLSPLITPRRRE